MGIILETTYVQAIAIMFSCIPWYSALFSWQCLIDG